MSDGREGVHRDIEKFARGVEAEISASLEAAGHEVVRASEPVRTSSRRTRNSTWSPPSLARATTTRPFG